MKRLALALAVAAVAVAAPRLVLIFLEADSLELSDGVRAALLGASGAALALVLTGGGAYLVHAIVSVGRFQAILFTLWLVILTCIAFLITPRLVAGLELASSPLAQVLSSPVLRWSWSFVAVLAAELVATGCMLAYAAEHQQQQELSELLAELEQTGRRSNQLEQQLRQAHDELEQHRLARAADELAAAAGQRLAGSAARAPSSKQPSPKSQPTPCRFGCGFLGANTYAERGHLASCPNHPSRNPEPDHA